MITGHPHRATIEPVSPGESRPIWSVMVPTFNCASYLPAAISPVLAQDMGPEQMQIEVVDDASREDDPAAAVEAVAGGRVGFFRQPRNLGVAGNLETCLRRARGRIVHILHGDDAVREGFYRRMQRAFEERPEVGAAFCRHIFIDEAGHWRSLSPLEQNESGILEDGLVRLAEEQRIMTPSIVVRREVYERLGGFDRRLICSEDWEMWVRIAAHYPIWYEVEPLALYRMHPESNTGRHLRTGEDMRYTRKAMEIFGEYLPGSVAGPVMGRARNTYALTALRTAEKMLRGQDLAAAAVQITEALAFSRSLKVMRRIVWLGVRGGLWLGRRALPHRGAGRPRSS